MKQKASDKNVVFVGNKPPMNYVLAVITPLSTGLKEIVIKARGRAISKAVDVTEIVRRRFEKDLKIKDIKISTEEITSEEGNKMNISFIYFLPTLKFISAIDGNSFSSTLLF